MKLGDGETVLFLDKRREIGAVRAGLLALGAIPSTFADEVSRAQAASLLAVTSREMPPVVDSTPYPEGNLGLTRRALKATLDLGGAEGAVESLLGHKRVARQILNSLEAS